MPTEIRRVRIQHILAAVNGTCWAILPEKLDEIAALLSVRGEGGALTREEIEAAMSSRRDRQQQQQGAVAVLPLLGTLLPRATALEESSGVMSLQRWGAMFDALVANPDIGTIVLDIDSPGGSVAGVVEAAERVFEARKQKRIIAVANSMMASAAYWIGSAAGEIVASPSALIGSIGVIHVHLDFSRALDAEGITPTFTTAGKFKGEGHQLRPLSDEARTHIKEMVNEYYDLFTAAVARHRKATKADVRNGFGEARALPARQALDARLIDRIATLEDVLGELGISSGRVNEARTRAEEQLAPAAITAGDISIAITTVGDVPGAALGATPSTPITLDPQAPDPVTNDNEGAGTEGGEPAELCNTPPAADATSEGPYTTEPAPGAEEERMPETASAPAGAGNVTVGADALAAANRRATEIAQMCAQHGLADKAAEFIASGESADAIGRKILGMKADEAAPATPAPAPLVDMTEKEMRSYSFARAILNAQPDGSTTGFEGEIDQEIRRKLGANPETSKRIAAGNGGFYVPTALGLPQHLARGRRSAHPGAVLETGGSNAGEDFVFTEPGSFIDLLRNRMVLTAMGATFLPGLQGNVAFPKQTGTGSFTWRDDNPNSDVGLTDLTTGQVTLTPRNGTAATSFSRQLLAQSVINVEQLVRTDIAARAAQGLDLAGLHGAGAPAPTGLYGVSGVHAVDFGGAVNFDSIVEMETKIVANNGDIGSMGYVATPEIRGAAKTTQKFSGTNGDPLWTGGVTDGEMNGFRAMASNQLSKTLGVGQNEHGMLFGVWEHLLIGEWGAMEILVDPYTKKRQALIEVVIFILADIAVRYPESFSKATGLTVGAGS